LFLALLGEADILTGHLLCPRSPPDSLASFAGAHVPKEQWIVKGNCAYVPQVKKQPSVNMKCEADFNNFQGSMASQRIDQRSILK
jgi:hypothetical protein